MFIRTNFIKQQLLGNKPKQILHTFILFPNIYSFYFLSYAFGTNSLYPLFSIPMIILISFITAYNKPQITNMYLQILAFIMAALLITIALLHRRASKYKSSIPQICLILGSGGHTTEMSVLFRGFDFDKCAKICVVIGMTDKMSQPFFNNYFKDMYKQTPQKMPKFNFIQTKRTNQVKQSKITSILTTLLASAHALVIVVRQLLGTTHLVSNGPGICVPYFFIFWLLNKLQITKTQLIFIQSWCRISSLSVSGKLVHYITDRFLVHWKNQEGLVKNAEYLGKII